VWCGFASSLESQHLSDPMLDMPLLEVAPRGAPEWAGRVSSHHWRPHLNKAKLIKKEPGAGS